MNNLELRVLTRIMLFSIFLGLMIFVPSWTIFYWQGWVYFLIISVSLWVTTLYFLKNDRALMERRIRIGPKAEQKVSQKIILTLFILLLTALVVVSVLDHRYAVSNVPVVFTIIAYLMVLFGIYIIYRVSKENSFASATVEVDQGQSVISSGPYAIVRHPMYSGALSVFMFTPMALGSLIGIIPAGIIMIILMMRAVDEEVFLKEHLSGYSEYCKRTIYRLLPYIW
jgi:protein-S-isoprenylcysteine O-methyltransferase Ste14